MLRNSRICSGLQVQDDVLDDLATLAVVADNEFIVGTGAGSYAHESGATARTSMGLGTIATFAGDQDLETTDNPIFASVRLNNAGLFLYDTDASHLLAIRPASNLTNNRTLSLATGDATRTITLSGDPTLADWFDQSVKQTATPTFAGATLTDNLSMAAYDITCNDITCGFIYISDDLIGDTDFDIYWKTGATIHAQIEYTADAFSINPDVAGGAGTINFGGAALETTGNLTVDTDTLVVDAVNHRIGIGTTSPSRVLHINQETDAITGTNVDISRLSTVIHNPADDTGEAVGLGFGISTVLTNVGAAIIHEREGSQDYGKLHFATKPSGAASEADIPIRITIDSAGNVGIGTTVPNAPLEVKGAKPGNVGGFQSGMFHVTGSGTAEFSNSVITGHSAYNTNTQLWYLGSTSSGNDDIAFINRQNAAMHFYTNNASRMSIDAAGNVGIGTATPSEALDLADGNLETTGNFTDGTNAVSVAQAKAAYNDKINSAAFNTADGIITLTQQDAGTVTVDIDGRYLPLAGGTLTGNLTLDTAHIGLDTGYRIGWWFGGNEISYISASTEATRIGITGSSHVDIWGTTGDVTLKAGDDIALISNGDTTDYIKIQTVSDVPEITTAGACELKLSNSLGTPRSVTVSEMEDAHDHISADGSSHADVATNSAYVAVGHLPLAGGTLTGNLVRANKTQPFFITVTITAAGDVTVYNANAPVAFKVVYGSLMVTAYTSSGTVDLEDTGNNKIFQLLAAGAGNVDDTIGAGVIDPAFHSIAVDDSLYVDVAGLGANFDAILTITCVPI